MLIFRYLDRLPVRSMGFTWGRWRHYGLATLYPVVVLSLVALISVAAGAIELSHINREQALLNLGLGAISTFLSR